MARFPDDSVKTARRPSIGAMIAGAVPFAALCFSVGFWDRIHPMVFGLPFNLFWLLAWIVLTPLCMWLAYRMERRRKP